MLRVETATRLHFGLLSLAAEKSCWPDRADAPAVPARRFGGVGLMVAQPSLVVRARRATAWSAVGPLAARALDFAHQFTASFPVSNDGYSPCALEIDGDAAEHVGLGTGTQLGLAVASALACLWGLDEPVATLARRVGRGLRSALGIHGFERGGFLVESGQLMTGALGTLAVRQAFPDEWRIVLARQATAIGLHGQAERQAMSSLFVDRPDRTEALCRLVLLGVLPALAERNAVAFGEALHDFNARAGEFFAPLQGGIYASPAIANLVAYLRGLGIRGVGQSSWGPTVFAVVADTEQAEWLRRQLESYLGSAGAVVVAKACNTGARLTTSDAFRAPSG